MRVTMRTLYDQIKTDLGRLSEQMSLKTAQLSSGKIYRRPSDAPVELTQALGLRFNLSQTNQVKRNVSYGQGWTRATDTVLTQVGDRLRRAKTLAIQGANDSQNAQSRQAIAQEVKGLLEEVVSLANTRFGGRYIFGGTRTKDYARGEAPFVMGMDGKVSYLGNRQEIEITVAEGTTKAINLNGEEAFIQGGVFESLDRLYDSLMSNSRDDIDASIGRIDKALDHIDQVTTSNGAVMNSLDHFSEIADNLDFTDTQRLSDIEDIDMVKTAADLNMLQTSYQASLAAASKVMQLSLADFI